MTQGRDEELLDGLEAGGGADGISASAGTALAEAREGLALAREAGWPEPGAEFWAQFERDVQRRLSARTPRGAAWLAAAAVLAGLLVLAPERLAPPRATPWMPLPPAEQDAGWEVLSGLGEETAALAPLSECRVEECVWELSETEQSALVGLLRDELAGRES